MRKTLAMVTLMTPFRRRISMEVVGCLEVEVDALRVGEEGEERRIRWESRAREAWV